MGPRAGGCAARARSVNVEQPARRGIHSSTGYGNAMRVQLAGALRQRRGWEQLIVALSQLFGLLLLNTAGARGHKFYTWLVEPHLEQYPPKGPSMRTQREATCVLRRLKITAAAVGAVHLLGGRGRGLLISSPRGSICCPICHWPFCGVSLVFPCRVCFPEACLAADGDHPLVF